MMKLDGVFLDCGGVVEDGGRVREIYRWTLRGREQTGES